MFQLIYCDSIAVHSLLVSYYFKHCKVKVVSAIATFILLRRLISALTSVTITGVGVRWNRSK